MYRTSKTRLEIIDLFAPVSGRAKIDEKAGSHPAERSVEEEIFNRMYGRAGTGGDCHCCPAGAVPAAEAVAAFVAAGATFAYALD